MKDFKGTKCEPGYIQKQKLFQSMMLLLFIVIGVGLFFAGFVITKTRANIFTVLAILMVLPAAKRVIALVVMVPRSSVEMERYDKMKQTLSDKAVLLTDYVFTSQDKIMCLDFVIVQNRHIIGILGEGRRRDRGYIRDYLQKTVDRVADGYQIKLVASDDEFYKFYERMAVGSSLGQEEEQEKVVEQLKVLAV